MTIDSLNYCLREYYATIKQIDIGGKSLEEMREARREALEILKIRMSQKPNGPQIIALIDWKSEEQVVPGIMVE